MLTLLDPQDHGREFCLGVVLEEDKYIGGLTDGGVQAASSVAQPQAGPIKQQGLRTFRELHDLVCAACTACSCTLASPWLSPSESKPMPSQLAPTSLCAKCTACSSCCLGLAAGCSCLHQTTWKPAASFLHSRQPKSPWEAKVTGLPCSAVTHCQPECGATVELLRELNGDGNFGQFIRSMRKAWQQQCS